MNSRRLVAGAGSDFTQAGRRDAVVRFAFVGAFCVAVLLVGGLARAQPHQAETSLNNDSVRATLLTFRPGAGTGRHLGIEPELGIVPEGELVLDTPEGQKTLGAGSLYWIPSLAPHDVRNGSTRMAKLWEILLKRCE